MAGYVLVGVWFFEWRTTTTFLLIVVPVLIVLFTIERIATRGPRAAKAWATAAIARADDPLQIGRDGAREDGGGVYLGQKTTILEPAARTAATMVAFGFERGRCIPRHASPQDLLEVGTERVCGAAAALIPASSAASTVLSSTVLSVRA